MNIQNKKIAILGCGNLGLSILNGLLEHPSITADQLIATRRNIARLDHLKDTGVTLTSDNVAAVRAADVIIVALKPYKILEVLATVQPELKEQRHLVVSLATGISLQALQETIQLDLPIFRAMPNTGADVGTSMTCICSTSQDANAKELVDQCFSVVGENLFISEDLMDSATVLGACGIAYVLRFIRGMIQGGIEIGFDAQTATKIVTQTVKGAAEMLIQRNNHPEAEIDKVTTPMGCTITGLNEMEHNGFSSALIRGIVASFDKIG